MTVYALANEGFVVPSPEQIKGKGELINEAPPKASSQSILRYASIGFLSMVIGAILFWVLGNRNSGEGQLLDKDIRNAKVAVGVFENFTGDENLDALGFMAAEWLSSGLRGLKVRTVSPEMVRQNMEKIGILPNNSNNEPSFAEITGAAYVVTGSYYTQGDSITLSTRLNSTTTGEVLQTFSELKGHVEKKEDLVKEASQYLLGYWAVRNDQQLPKINPPKYEAYQAFLKCLPTQQDCYEQVLELDSTFLAAYIFQMASTSVKGNDPIFYRNKAFVEKNWDQTTPYEKLMFKGNNDWYEGNYVAYQEWTEEIYELDPKDPFSIHNSAYAYLLPLNQPQAAARRFEEIFANLPFYEEKIEGWSYYHYIDALNRGGEHKKASDFYFNLPEKIKSTLRNRAIRYTLAALIYQNRLEEALDLIEETGDKKEAYLQAAFMYQYIFPKGENPFQELLVERVHQFSDELGPSWEGVNRLFDWSAQASVYYVLGEWQQAEAALLNMQSPMTYTRTEPYASFPEYAYWEKLWHTGMLGCVYAQLGEREQCEAQLALLDELGKLYDPSHATFHRGTTPYLKARIYAELEEKEQAVKYLQEAVKAGRLFGYMSFTLDMFLVNLKGYEPFEELIRPKG